MTSAAEVSSALAALKEELAWEPCLYNDVANSKRACTQMGIENWTHGAAALAKLDERFKADFSGVYTTMPATRWHPGAPQLHAHVDHYHQRLVDMTILVYLNDASPNGAALEFPKWGLSLQPNKGDVVAFVSTDAHGSEDAEAHHTVTPYSESATEDRFVPSIPQRSVPVQLPSTRRSILA